MSSFLCFVCHSTVNADTKEETREKYREVIGMNLCPDSHLCYICCYFLNKMWMFKSICLKRSLEYPVLFSPAYSFHMSPTPHFERFQPFSVPFGNINDNVSHVNDSVSKLHENVTNIHKEAYQNNNGTNLIDNITNLNDNENSGSDNETNPNYSETNLGNESNLSKSESETDTNEFTPNNNHVKEYNSPEEDNLPDFEENHEPAKKKQKKRKKKEPYEKIILTPKEQKSELERARKDEKYVNASYKCHSCAMYFHFKDTYQTHMMRHEESNGEHSCAVCSLRFANPAVLRSHAANHSARYKCARCGERVRARQRPTHARLCARERDSVCCQLCGREFQSVQHQQQHLRRYHGARLRRYPCNVCGQSYDTRAHLRTHIITHINRKFECDQCSSTFSSPYTLNQHTKAKHTTKQIERHDCAACKLTYNTRKSLLAHLRNALAHKNCVYECEVCGRACPSQAALERHAAAVHARPRHLACRVCHKRYSTTKALVRHMTSHKEGRPVPLCHACGATFKSVTILKKHLRNVCEKDARKCQTIDEELLQVTFF